MCMCVCLHEFMCTRGHQNPWKLSYSSCELPDVVMETQPVSFVTAVSIINHRAIFPAFRDTFIEILEMAYALQLVQLFKM